MSLTPEEQAGIENEQAIFATVTRSVSEQIVKAEDRLYSENQRARALTSAIHETRRLEDKALLASDEAVSHGLKDSKKAELEVLRKQIVNPYFARIQVEEDEESGDTKVIEYKLGFSANPDLRIIDWRRAPVSKLYYEYKEGDEYIEEILGRERAGKVVLRNRIEVEKGNLKTIQNRNGTYMWDAKGGESGALRLVARIDGSRVMGISLRSLLSSQRSSSEALP